MSSRKPNQAKICDVQISLALPYMALLPQIPVVKMNDELTEEEQIDLFDSLFG